MAPRVASRERHHECMWCPARRLCVVRIMSCRYFAAVHPEEGAVPCWSSDSRPSLATGGSCQVAARRLPFRATSRSQGTTAPRCERPWRPPWIVCWMWP